MKERIPSLPEQVLIEDVQNKLKGVKKVPVGIESGTLDIKTFDLTVEVGKLVLSSKMKYLKNFINSFIDELIFLKKNIMIIDSIGLMPELSSKTKNYFTSELEASLPCASRNASAQAQRTISTSSQ